LILPPLQAIWLGLYPFSCILKILTTPPLSFLKTSYNAHALCSIAHYDLRWLTREQIPIVARSRFEFGPVTAPCWCGCGSHVRIARTRTRWPTANPFGGQFSPLRPVWV